MSPISRTVRLGDLEVHYLEVGQGQPLLLLHGGTATADSWRDAMSGLSQHYRVIAPDTRGHGRSNNPAQRLSYSQFADDVADLVSALELNRPVVIGYSDGGLTALELALRHDGLASALVFGGTVTRATPNYLKTIAEWGFVAPGRIDLERISASFGQHLGYIQTAHAHHYGAEYWRSFLSQISELWLSLPEYSDQQLTTVTTPSLVVSGDRDDLVSIEESVRLYRLVPGAELAIVPGAGHDAVNGRDFWTLVRGFLDRHTG